LIGQALDAGATGRSDTLAAMRTSNSAAILLLGIIVGCAAERVLTVPPARAGTTPQRWEYACHRANDENDATKLANQFGQQGWELASAADFSSGGYGYVIWCFKRPLP
jgi:hypothetical protein